MENSSEEHKEDINIQDLRKRLKRGHFTKISKKLEVTPQCISNQFNPKTKIKSVKPEVIIAALEVLKEEEQLKNELNKQIKSA